MSLSVGILTFNSERYLKEVLESVKSIADEIVILDSGSKDRTIEIAKSFGAKVFFRKFDNFVSQKNYLLSLCKKEWVLFIDDDEVVGNELKAEIERVKKEGSFDGYYVNVLTNYLGRWIKYAWYPDWHLRLAKREKCKWIGDLVHESLKVDGKLGYLKGNLLHYSYPSISHHLKKIDLYTSLYAEGVYRRGKKFSYMKLFLSPLGAFLRRYIFKKGFLDGFEGFVLSVMSSYYTFLKYLKLWEKEKNEKTFHSR
ncbi:glycosyl transferase family 2 [Desulfurobacterium thermolithotrophum DSM 11699]|uniref:Glycosyl transferase family 2 n=1 Tax=Desulfurobacterium thermolithotrophum (strain DSM 11699 / BSA) TaxID=868864 RepID=F0S1Y7_DESTD|nr:glycosyltransferase family 2 protein [Desulfurobacterium thermolithotrophum]ADY74068.1 glycosyl transferase family 2 [Desulfurobacterium thermolithotrophum DSM 11699]